MARIALIPTGRMEWLALGPALNRLFPGHSFYSAPAADPLDSLTSCDVSRLALRRNNADKLVARSALEVLTNPRKGGADFAIIVEDLELYNLSQAAIVTSAVRSAVQRHLDRLSDLDLRARTREALRERVSYHLAKPMTESWFFADPLGIQRAGVSPERGAKLVPDASIEDFQSADQDYELATDEYCVRWRGLPSSNGHEEKRKNKLRPDWIKAGADRSRHNPRPTSPGSYAIPTSQAAAPIKRPTAVWLRLGILTGPQS